MQNEKEQFLYQHEIQVMQGIWEAKEKYGDHP